jgi:hypothetical protein
MTGPVAADTASVIPTFDLILIFISTTTAILTLAVAVHWCHRTSSRHPSFDMGQVDETSVASTAAGNQRAPLRRVSFDTPPV